MNLSDLLPTNYLLTLWLHNAILAAVCYVTGLMVQRWSVKVNYTRKINHFALMIIPFGLAPVLPYDPNPVTITVTLVVFVIATSLFAAPIRSRFPMVATAFASVDRPEDRPHTLPWILTQAIASYAVLVGVFWILSPSHPELLALPLVITGVGDGLAEPIGVRFGRHRYRVPSLAAGRRYTRSVEGSAVVGIVSVAVVIGVGGNLTSQQWWALILATPVIMTVAEAVSPHSWDAPILYAAGGLVAWAAIGLF